MLSLPKKNGTSQFFEKRFNSQGNSKNVAIDKIEKYQNMESPDDPDIPLRDNFRVPNFVK